MNVVRFLSARTALAFALLGEYSAGQPRAGAEVN